MRGQFATALAFGLLAAAPVYAQSGQALNAAQKQGQQILFTSCGLCHTQPNINSPHMAPALSKETLGGNAQDIVAFVQQGTETMPGFRFMYSDQELATVAEYLKTVEPEHEEKK